MSDVLWEMEPAVMQGTMLSCKGPCPGRNLILLGTKLLCKKSLECQSLTDAIACTVCKEMYKQGREGRDVKKGSRDRQKRKVKGGGLQTATVLFGFIITFIANDTS